MSDNSISEEVKKNLDLEMKTDKELENESTITTYLNHVTENLKSNNRKITRNSFWLILSFTIYLLIKDYSEALTSFSFLFLNLSEDSYEILLNIIPVFFSFIFLQNVALWNNNSNLIILFDRLSTKLFKLAPLSDTKNIIRPFSFVHHIVNYQYTSKKINELLKVPLFIMFTIIMFSPIVWELYMIY